MIEALLFDLNATQNTREYIFFLDSFAKNIKVHEVEIQPYSKESLQKFLSLPQERQEMAMTHFYSYVDLVGGADVFPIKDKIPKDVTEQDLLRLCSRKLEIRFSDDIYGKITDEDIVEVYTKDLIQIYRSLRFFNLSSYDLLELLSYEFHELYERSFQVNSYLFEAGQKLINRDPSLAPVDLSFIPKHVMREKISHLRVSFMIQFKEMYPIYTLSNEFYGYVVIQGANKIDTVDSNVSFI